MADHSDLGFTPAKPAAAAPPPAAANAHADLGFTPAPDPVEAASDPKTWGHSGMTWGQMATHILASPVTSLLQAPQQIIDFFANGAHNNGPSGGFLTEEPGTMAYGNALAAVGGAIGEKPAGPPSTLGVAVKGAAKKVTDVVTHPATREAVGVISPRLKHALDMATRVRRAVDAFKGEPGEAATAAAPEPEPAPAPAAASLPPRTPLRPPMAEPNPPAPQTAAVPPAAAPRVPVRPPTVSKAAPPEPTPTITSKTPVPEASPVESVTKPVAPTADHASTVMEMARRIEEAGIASPANQAQITVKAAGQLLDEAKRVHESAAKAVGWTPSDFDYGFPEGFRDLEPGRQRDVAAINYLAAIRDSAWSKFRAAVGNDGEWVKGGSTPTTAKPPAGGAQPTTSTEPPDYAATARATRADNAASMGGAIYRAEIPASDLDAMTIPDWKTVAKAHGVEFPRSALAQKKLIQETIAEVKRLEAQGSEAAPGPQLVPKKTAPEAVVEEAPVVESPVKPNPLQEAAARNAAKIAERKAKLTPKAAELTPEVEEQALRAWADGTAYIDNQGNYHVKAEGSSRGPIASWNKQIKAKYPDVAELHDGAQKYVEAEAQARVARLVRRKIKEVTSEAPSPTAQANPLKAAAAKNARKVAERKAKLTGSR